MAEVNKNDISEQKPFTTNQIEQTKPAIPTSVARLSGFIANSMNAGHNRTIAWKRVMAGEKHYQMNIKLNIQMLTPKTPPYQNLNYTIRCYWVPDKFVWQNAYKFKAQKGGATITKIEKMPSIVYKDLIAHTSDETTKQTNIQNTTLWRDSWISSYIPRTTDFRQSTNNDVEGQMPEYCALLLRGRVAIWNEFERHKEYEPERTLYTGDSVSDTEWNSYLPKMSEIDYYSMRAKKGNSYYTDYRTEMQGLEEQIPISQPAQNINTKQQMALWADWEAKFAEARSQAENAQKTDWEIIAELSGAGILTEQRPVLLSEKTFRLNYSAITQSTYNTAANIQPEFQVMGKQGAYSYTEIKLPIYVGQEFKEDGTLHFIATATADTVYEQAYDRTAMNVYAMELYRPELAQEKLDTIWVGEVDARFDENVRYELGYKRKFSELFKMPNVIAGDMTTNNYFQSVEDGLYAENSQVITQKTYQFFELNAHQYIREDGSELSKKIWKDYSDLAVNKNQAILNYVTSGGKTNTPELPGIGATTSDEITIDGNHQIFFSGYIECYAELPVDKAILDNYTVWGEH